MGVDQKIAEQIGFVQWWRDNVTTNRGVRTDINTDLRLSQLSKDKAEVMTGIRQQQVSRWAKRLQDWEKYRADLCGAVYIVQWWRDNVTVRQSPGRDGVKSSPERRTISVAESEIDDPNLKTQSGVFN